MCIAIINKPVINICIKICPYYGQLPYCQVILKSEFILAFPPPPMHSLIAEVGRGLSELPFACHPSGAGSDEAERSLWGAAMAA